MVRSQMSCWRKQVKQPRARQPNKPEQLWLYCGTSAGSELCVLMKQWRKSLYALDMGKPCCTAARLTHFCGGLHMQQQIWLLFSGFISLFPMAFPSSSSPLVAVASTTGEHSSSSLVEGAAHVMLRLSFFQQPLCLRKGGDSTLTDTRDSQKGSIVSPLSPVRQVFSGDTDQWCWGEHSSLYLLVCGRRPKERIRSVVEVWWCVSWWEQWQLR